MGTPSERMFDTHFQEIEKRYQLPPNLLREVARAESNFNPKARSPKGAVGLMQIVPNMHPSVDPNDPVASIEYSGRWLKELHEEFGSWGLALAAYNAGPGAVKKYGGIPPYEETIKYVEKITDRLGASEEASPLRAGVFNMESSQQPTNQVDILLQNIRQEIGKPNPTQDAPQGTIGRSRINSAIGGVREAINEKLPQEKFDLTDLPFVGPYIERAQGALNKARTGSSTIPDFSESNALTGPGFLEHISPAIPGGSALSKVKFLNKYSPFRSKGSHLSSVAKQAKPQGSLSIASIGKGSRQVERIIDKGYDLWKSNLKGMNPSRLDRFLSNIPAAQKPLIQRGMIDGLAEHIANAGRITKEMQNNLLSPMGRKMLQETFRGMPPGYYNDFIRLVEQGQHQNATRFLISAGLTFQLARKLGRVTIEQAGEGF